MTTVPESLREDFFAGRRSRKLPFCVNDSVDVVAGEYAGRRAAVISIEGADPDTRYLVEFGDTGRDAVLAASELQLARAQGA